jgi:hypothetical protein
MGSRSVLVFALTSAIFAVAILAQAQAADPSARELIALSPILDSSDEAVRSLDVGGWFGCDEDLAPKLRFRALYRTPNQFSLLISDAEGAPLAFCVGTKMFLYDPVGPTVYYSENASFTLQVACTLTGLKFKYNFLLNTKKPHRIFVDFRSVMLLFQGQSQKRGDSEDRVVKRNASEFELIRFFENRPYLTINIDLAKKCPYTEASVIHEGITYLRRDRLILNDRLGDELFVFPAKQLFTQGLPVSNVREDADVASALNLTDVLTRASIVRAVVKKAGPSGPINIPGLSGVNWDRVRVNDKKFAKSLRLLVPASYRAR